MITEYPPEQNPFEVVIVDVTHRCNMACANCYLPNRVIPDMDIDRLIDCLSRLPKRVSVRIAGAEATVREDLPEIIQRIKKAGHRAILLSNGLKLANTDYVQTLKDAGLRHLYLSMNGADIDEWYLATDNMRCAARKLAAIKNAIAHRLVVQTGTILKRGLNEGAVNRMIAIARETAPMHIVLRFKNVGAMGRYDAEAEATNLSMEEMEALVAAEMGCDPRELSCFDTVDGVCDRNSRFFPLVPETRPGRGIWIKLTNWAADESGRVDPQSQRRGRVTQSFNLAPFFDHVQENEGGY